jgi:hypothetical protein
LTEKWTHRQQILRALGRDTDLRPDLARPVLEALRWAYPFRLSAHQRPRGTFIRIDITDEHVGQEWMLVSNGDVWEFDGASPTSESASMVLTGDQAWKLLTNNYDVALDGPLDIAGDPELVATLAATRAIIGTPS